MKIFFSAFFAALIGVVFLLSPGQSFAASLITASDTITTSRPSPSSPLTNDVTAVATQANIFNNGSRFLASDSARLINSATGGLVDTGTIVSSQSAALTSIFFAEQTGVAGSSGVNVLFVPITAMHSIQFTTVTEVPNTGDILLTFPELVAGDANNEASPSATTFQFNNLDANEATHIQVVDDGTDITANVTVVATNPSGGGDGGDITITVDTGVIAAGSAVEIFLGCTSVSGGACDAQAPVIINPTKTAAAGTADTWKINIDTRDAADSILDTATVAVGTIDSVQVQATVDPTLTFTIGGIADATASNTGNSTGCTNAENTNSGIGATATSVSLGILDPANINISAQLLSITTNATGGYALTATTSGNFRDFSTGFDIPSTNALPGAFFTVGAPHFGVHACGLDVDTGDWGSGATGGGAGARYAWPTQTSPLTFASDNTGPIDDNILSDGNGLITVKYAGTVNAAVPAGLYQAYITYVATPTF